VIVAVLLLPVSYYASVVFLRGASQTARQFIVVIKSARDKSVTPFVVIGFAFVAFVVRAAHEGIQINCTSDRRAVKVRKA
jgi:hypothetical protein